MKQPFYQGYLDNTCGLYSLLNAYRIVNHATEEECQKKYVSIIRHLGKKKKLEEFMIGGINHSLMSSIIWDVMTDNFSAIDTDKKAFQGLSDWWLYSKEFLERYHNSTIILSLGGLVSHLTVINGMTDKTMFLSDSSGVSRISKSKCKLMGYDKSDKFIIYSSQCWYLY